MIDNQWPETVSVDEGLGVGASGRRQRLNVDSTAIEYQLDMKEKESMLARGGIASRVGHEAVYVITAERDCVSGSRFIEL